ncbi:2,5-dihydroxypyridine 5,6-dioxygenase [Brucella pituitosa]|uniref:2,5-dihydroxypyridine 5,6-dioxygenase n=1 Tax=Brucella pituitosa TaxID=571256 RepID=UPI000C27151F|nr:2,5-dihydroxypyridine 5,6-dioxygenase [Brucella pituitosa]MCK4205425.1 2,5-dihydroxypyridine 5,6-dioxygenase [Brucella pituitosa]PJO49093.1 2,5-dihydroxypyridine 5,6-dioxygenase [Brucella pituitosa]PRA84926.1 2,5-dihydroxypyridine 5,6-dioxygenase [Ochrobactrum sp. MYb29]
MSISDAQFLKGWRQVLEMCNLKAGEQVTILTSDDSNKQIAYIAKLAASDLGAVVTELNLAPVNSEKAISPDKSGYIGKTPLDGNEAALACLKASDLVIDTLQLLFSKEQEQVLKTGTRMLLAVEPPAIMMRQIPRPEDKLRVLAAAKKIGAAKEMHVTSKAGTDFRCRLGQYPVLTQYGLADEPGRWDHWPSCFSARWPDEGSAEGTIVIDEGDILLPFKKYARSPITVTIEKGFIVDIKGGYDAEFMRKFMESFNDPRAYAMAHVGWGLENRANWTVLGLYNPEAQLGMDARSFAGNFLWSSGPNTEAGGDRDTPCHLDIPLRNCSVSLDGEVMTLEGTVIPEDQK